ncbi:MULTISPECIES: HAMP domain-containing sensor histidine kinase [Exiguobacterium]|uniref:histidine kinase n=1 Tax=Exiguobacterium sibiricum (strain DSM 17290 / CCUG 55495 / CIP 109462 / JCM 13490 / 255-15) TaxID=262543 RepID=B1YFQ1_EXIS2|nr:MULTISPECIES: HAMP domain-containing sensor histidine kinase [Exiguobacterium]ACB62376.1 integral membrane sensor signal transduction histidine kinase [Exiguobacterium sibiricum 255-15]MCT4792885.1 HAMP domain-containing histidine kinase [Exiguobacterium artemiae]
MLETIRKRLTLLFSGTFLLLLILILVGVYFTTARLLDQTELNQLKSVSDRDLFERIEHGEDRLIRNPIYFQIMNPDGSVRFTSLPDDLPAKTLQRFMTADEETQKVEFDDRHYLLYQRDNDEQGMIVLMKDISATQDTLQRLIAMLAGITILSTLVLMGLSYVLAGRSVVPVQQAFDRQRRFTSDASHELRTPLTILYSGIELLETEPLSTEGKTILSDLKAETASMQYLVSDLLLLAREGQPGSMSPIDLSTLVTQTSERFKHTLVDRTLALSVAPNLLIKGDPNQLIRLLTIFLENAAAYSDANIEVYLQQTSTDVRLTIADHGIGIPPENYDKIFERFFRGDHSRHGTGTGLGLAIAKSIADAHQATIFVESTPETGTRFTILFPIS